MAVQCLLPNRNFQPIISTLRRRVPGAAVALWGLAASAWASSGGGACHRCSLVPVIQTHCNVVALGPQCQPLTETVYETVYQHQPYTVMEPRYRQAFRTENYTV